MACLERAQSMARSLISRPINSIGCDKVFPRMFATAAVKSPPPQAMSITRSGSVCDDEELRIRVDIEWAICDAVRETMWIRASACNAW